MTVGGTEGVRRANVRALLRAVHVGGPATRSELTRSLGLNRSTIGALTSELVSLGLVVEGLSSSPGPGRPSHLVVPDADNAVVAVDLRVDWVDVALVGLGGEVLERRSSQHGRGMGEIERVIDLIAVLTQEVLSARKPRRFMGVGVSVPGAVEANEGIVRFAPAIEWTDEPFGARLADRLGVTVHVGNDANLGVLAEQLRGAAVGHDNVVYLAANVGIGGGVLVGGQLLAGASGFAGEIGHLPVADGPKCHCGGFGCWELLAGEDRLLELAGYAPGGGSAAVAEILDAMHAGEQRACSAVAEVARWTGVGLRGVLNVLDPELVVLGGSLAQLWNDCADDIERSVGTSEFRPQGSRALIRTSSLGIDSSLVGAAEMAFADVLNDPQRVGV
jgi:predicted NBD/HSP70 family sugar kinase